MAVKNAEEFEQITVPSKTLEVFYQGVLLKIVVKRRIYVQALKIMRLVLTFHIMKNT